MSDRLNTDQPLGWRLMPISEVAEVNPKLDKRGIGDALEISFVPMPAVAPESGAIDVSTIRCFSEVKKGYTSFLERDVLFAKITPCMENGKMAVVPALRNNIGFGSTEFHVLRAGPEIEPKYLYYFVSSKRVRHDAEHNMAGAVGQKRVPTGYISNYKIQFPSRDQQSKIVAKIETLFSELDKGIESLKIAREQLKVYRQAVLKHAFEGKLTALWREQNKHKLETPQQLLARIQKERQARYQQQLQGWEASLIAWERSGKVTKKPGRLKKLAVLKVISEKDISDYPHLPGGWSYVRLGSLIDEPTYGTSKKCDYETGEVGVLRIPNISHGAIDPFDLKFASFGEDEIKTLSLADGDLLTIRSNGSLSLVGSCALVTEKETTFLFAGYLIRLRPNRTIVTPNFLLHVLSSELLRRQIEAAAKSTSGVNNINTGEIQNLIIPMPSLEEQDAILKILEASISNINVTAIEIDIQIDRSETLGQSILKKAFSGQLVPQDPNDEPASVLLARIQAERDSQVAKPKTPLKRRPKASSTAAS